MDLRIFFFFTAVVGVAYGVSESDSEELLSNYELSRQNKQLGVGVGHNPGQNAGGGYGYPYPGNNYHTGSNYPSGPTGPGLYPGTGYPGNYPGSNYNPGVAGPPGAHPGCPLCDSSVYSYCSYKQAHDSCCCENPSYLPYHCRKSSCNSLYANSCQEYRLISSCCCIDVQKNAVDNIVPVV